MAPILNKQIDAIFHPLGEQDPIFYYIDSLAHHIVEASDQLVISTYKTIRYNGPKIQKAQKKRKRQGS